MKKYFLFYFLTCIYFGNVKSQINYVCVGDSIYLNCGNLNGNIQWQQSVDSINWINIQGANYSPYGIIFWSNKYYRAELTTNGCLPKHSIVKAVYNNIGCPPPSYPPGSVFCSGLTVINPVTNPITGRTWMDRNLGASQVATSSTDINSYGFLYQWGRRSDGHQCRTSSSTAVISSVNQPNHSLHIMCNGANITNDWRNPQNPNLWQGVGGVNNPCPTGYRLPTDQEFLDEISTWSSLNSIGAFQSVLKLPLGGMRGYVDGAGDPILNTSTQGYYWTSSTFDDPLNNYQKSGNLRITTSDASVNSGSNGGSRARGLCVRCIKE
jgi:uncharacterized protein (TIGR02145 family)